ncbi:MAG: SpoIVB peptidase [Ruminococcaceae bacterium]|nr:SpoIVB peptidase [Oscillospiraceae bacterium]
MKAFFKTLSFIGLVITSVIFGFVFFSGSKIPDEIHLMQSEKLEVGKIFSDSAYAAAVNAAESGRDNNSYTVSFTLLKTIPIKSSSVTVTERRYAVPGGEAFGLKIYTEGVMVVGMDSVTDGSITVNPGKEAGLEAGDIITHIDGAKVSSSDEVTNCLHNANKSVFVLSVSRNGMPYETTLNTVRDQNGGGNKAGLWIRDSTAGVGTLTFYSKSDGTFAGLGHGVCDIDTGRLLPLAEGQAVGAVINGCFKSESGTMGELCGAFTDEKVGDILYNRENGVYGILSEDISDKKELPVAVRQEIQTGAAQIISTVDSEGPKFYDIQIVKISDTNDKNGKNMVIEVTDPALLEKTGGIVQGMSGSPIIQNGMLVGAVTHVFLNDSTQGYAIFAENMLEASDEIGERFLTDKAS